jgi:hypothetical protein
MDSGIIPGSPLFSLPVVLVRILAGSFRTSYPKPAAGAATVCPEDRKRAIMFAAITQNGRHKSKPRRVRLEPSENSAVKISRREGAAQNY